MISKWKAPVAGALALSVLAVSAMSAEAAIIAVDLDVISKSNIGPLGVSLGTVTVSDIAGGVIVDVKLLSGAAFVDTGGPHTAFAYNLNLAPTSVTITAPNPNLRTEPGKKGKPPKEVPLFKILTGAQSATPYGSFSNGIDCPGCGPGASNAYGGPLSFTVMGVSVANFVGNSSKGSYLFAADVIGPNGGTGSIAGNQIREISSAVPEPSTWAMMLVGFGGLGLAAMRRRRAGEAQAA
jgi:hypothetical protein